MAPHLPGYPKQVTATPGLSFPLQIRDSNHISPGSWAYSLEGTRGLREKEDLICAWSPSRTE